MRRWPQPTVLSERADVLLTGPQWLGQHAQTRQQKAAMGLGRFGGPRGHGQRGDL